MNAAIISIGDEILIGQIVNTNATFISKEANKAGINISRILVTGDNKDEIISALAEEYGRHDILFITGGLGPTHDDVTRGAICDFFKTRLIPSAEARRYVEEFLRQRNREWSDAAEDQTYIPEGSVPIPNKYGTAAGEFFERDGKFVFVMPGVPYEMESMMTDFVIPFFKKYPQQNYILHRTLLTTGIPESELAARLGDIEKMLRGAKLAFLPSPYGVRLRISVGGLSREKCASIMAEIEGEIRSKAERYIYGSDDETLEEIIGKLLAQRSLTLSVAESCTGGLIANRLTNIPGSSNYLDMALVAYSNESKMRLLNVPKELISKFGAVSEQVAKAMASGIRTRSGTNIGLSTTGIAGPGGATAEKPVGLVWIGYSDADEELAFKFNFGEGRIRVKERASQAALDLLRIKILKI